VAYSNEAGEVVVVDGQRLDRDTKATGHAVAGGHINSIAFTPDGAHIMATSQDGRATVLETATGRPTAVLLAPSLSHLRFDADASRLLVVPQDDPTELRDVAVGSTIVRIGTRPARWAGFDRHGGLVGVLDATGRYLSIWNVEPERRSPDEIARVLAERSTWRLEHGRLTRLARPAL
jgi:hypothetical protein